MDKFENNIVLDLPSVSKIEFTKINKKYLKVILINFFLVFISLLIGLILLDAFVFSDKIKSYSIIYYSSFFLIFSFVFSSYLIGFPLKMYALRELDITYKSGWFYKTTTTIPFSRIQHLEIEQGPISRYFHLSSLSIFTAGDSSNDLIIKGLKKEESQKLKEFISLKLNN